MKPTFIEFTLSMHRHLNREIHDELIDLVNDHLPSGSGFDSGTTFDHESSTEKKLVFKTSYRHMNEHGFYTRWTDHKITVTPGLYGPEIKISGRDHNQIKDYISDVFHDLFTSEISDSMREKYIEIVKSAKNAA